MQHLIHQFKYNGRKEIGVVIGKMYGHELLTLHLISQRKLLFPFLCIKAKGKKEVIIKANFLQKGYQPL